MSKITKTLLGIFAVAFSWSVFSVAAFAEGGSCNGVIEGYVCNNQGQYSSESCYTTGTREELWNPFPSTVPGGISSSWDKGHYNENSGMTDFNSHGGSEYTTYVDLSIVGLEPGLAPATKGYAACVDTTEADDEYELKGYAWNTNLGFISFYCNGTTLVQGSNLGKQCGNYEYGAVLTKTDEDTAELSGHAWNPVFGYIKFRGTTTNGAAYGVKADLFDGYWYLSGYAWSQAGIYLNFDGVRLQLPTPVTDCAGEDGVCFEIVPDPATMKYDYAAGADLPPLADGEDGYQLVAYLRDGGGPIDLNEYDVEATLSWQDSVRADQVSDDDDGTWNSVETPWTSGGGVSYKPVNISFSADDLSDWDDSEADDGKYVLNQKITSYAPTTNANLSLTSSTKPKFPFENDRFWTDVKTPNKLAKKASTLKLMSVTYDLTPKVTGLTDPPEKTQNFNSGIALKFRPLFELRDLFAEADLDAIPGVIAVPTALSLKGADNGEQLDNLKVLLKLDKFGDGDIDSGICGESGVDFGFEDSAGVSLGSELLFEENGYEYATGDLLSGDYYNLFAKATAEGQTCTYFDGPTLYSEISYEKDGRTIKYYGNKLPRLASDPFATPSIVVQGNIYAQFANVPSKQADPVLTTGDTVLNLVKDTVNRNVKRYVKDGHSSDCNIAAFGSSECGGATLIEGENVYYVTGSDVTLQNGAGLSWKCEPGDGVGCKKVVIADGGNIYINSNIYNEYVSGKYAPQLVLVALKSVGGDEGASGNVFIDAEVTNVQATIVADGVVSSRVDVDWDDAAGQPTNFVNYFSNLAKSGYQLFIEGSISAKNTIGGANLPSGRTQYLGRANRPIVDKLLAQFYDLNYLRLFRAELEICDEVVTVPIEVATKNVYCEAVGLPIDQRCRKGLTNDDILSIASGEIIDNPFIGFGLDCNGIDPFKLYSATATDNSGPDGDLVPTTDKEKLAQGLNNCKDDEGSCTGTDFSPVYVYYRPADSFLFVKR